MMISLSSSINAQQIEVFTLSTLTMAMETYQVRLCELDAMEKITKTIQTASSDLTTIQDKVHEQMEALTKAYDCIARASAYGLTALPAIVLDEQFVTYGIHSVKQADDLLSQTRGLSHD